MRKIKRFVHKHPRYSYVLYVVCVLSTGVGVLLAFLYLQLPSTVWLPDNSHVTEEDVMTELPVKSKIVATSYGSAVRYTSAIDRSANFNDPSPWITLDEFRASSRLKPSACPDIQHLGSLLPSGCDKVGTLHGNPVYRMSRRLPSSMVEYFVQVDGTFIHARSTDGGPAYNFFQNFVAFPRRGTGDYLSSNNARAEQTIKQRQGDNAALKTYNESAYTYLNFKPALATAVPPGWSLNPKNITIDGPDVQHPKLVSTSYYTKKENGQKDKYVSWYSFSLTDAVVMGTCGPTPGYGMGNLACTREPGTDCYVSEFYNELGSFVRFTYAPVGQSLVVTMISSDPMKEANRKRPTDLIEAQDLIAKSAKSIDKSKLKGSTFDQIFYDP